MIYLILKLSFLTSVWVIGLTIVTQERMALGYVRKAAEERNKKIYETLILCEWCMPSTHTLVGFLFAFLLGIVDKVSAELVIVYIVSAMLSSFVCGFLWSVYKLIEKQIELLTHKEELAFFDVKDRKKNHYSNLKNDKYAYRKENGLQSERR